MISRLALPNLQKAPPIYLDNHATTRVDPRVADAIFNVLTNTYGNPNSSDHIFGDLAADLIVGSQIHTAALVGADPEGVHFTSGSTEAIGLAIAHAVATRHNKAAPLRVAASLVEHRAVMDVIAMFVRLGEISVRWLPVDICARLNMEAVEEVCRTGIDLICVMAANNEVGTIYPSEELAAMAHDVGAQILIDATQAVGRVPINATVWGITYLSISGHKIYGPKGVGALITLPEFSVRDAHGRLRSTGAGTPNVPGIVGLGEACRLRKLEMAIDEPRIVAQRDHLQELLTSSIGDIQVNGDKDFRLSNNLHISIPGVPNDAVLARLRSRVAMSTGAACSSAVETPSHVLEAMGLPKASQDGALRIGLGKFTTDDEINRAATYIVDAARETRLAVYSR